MKSIVLITLVNPIWTRRKIKFDQLLLNLDHGNQEQPFTKPDQEDLSKRRYNLLIKAKGLIANSPSVAYAFSDINYSLVSKFNDNTYRYFNSDSELNNLLNPEFKCN